MPHQGNSPADIIGYDGQGRPIYKGHRNGNRNGAGVRRDGNRNGNMVMRNNYNSRTTMVNNSNPITRTFNAPQSPRYYKPDGQVVRIGAPLHQHQDGTIMTKHTMTPNDDSVVVTTSQPKNQVRSVNRRRTTRARTNTMRNNTSRRTIANRVNRRPRRTGGTSY
tara:strand:- start:5415 stop:5906 length:492 start_codon:yes stop_codon:yes gene_type:complete